MSARLKTEKGTQLIEMAMLSPFLVALALGATDFARVAYWSITVANAARTGAQYAIQSELHSNKTAQIQTAGQNTLLLSDMPGPTGGILIKCRSGAFISVSDNGIIISNGVATITLLGPTVDINMSALTIT